MQHLALALLALLLTGPVCAAPEYPQMGPDLYDPKADGSPQIASALARATSGNKRVLLVFGANWCIWCRRLHTTFAGEPSVARALDAGFEVVLLDVNTRNGSKRNAAVNERYGNPIAHGLPVLVVLDAAGKKLTTQETGALEDGAKHSPEKIRAFLAKWAPPPR
jgi:thiol:disulfide interchange protein